MKTGIITALIIATTSVGFAQDATNSAAPVEPPSVTTTETTDANPPALEVESPDSSDTIIEYTGADIKDVLRALARQADINLIMGEDIVGTVTVRLKNVTHENAMRIIAESKGYTFVKDTDKGVAKVLSRASLEAEEPDIRLVTLKYATTKDIVASVKPLMSPRGRIQEDARTSSVIVTEIPSRMPKLVSTIEALDTPTPQVMIESKLIEVTDNPTKARGLDWSDSLSGKRVGFSNTEDGNFRLAVSGLGMGGSRTRLTPLGDVVEQFITVIGEDGTPVTSAIGNDNSAAVLDLPGANALLYYINTSADTELLANPRIVTTDNKEAKISIATQEPIPNFTFNDQTASFAVSGFEFKDIGTILKVTPHINKDDLVTLDVVPEVSLKDADVPFQTGGSGGGGTIFIPRISIRTLNTRVMVRSGQVLAMGGLLQRSDNNSYTKVPHIGDAPLIGNFFRSKRNSTNKKNLLIFIAPTVLREELTGLEDQYQGLKTEPTNTRGSVDSAKAESWFDNDQKPWFDLPKLPPTMR